MAHKSVWKTIKEKRNAYLFISPFFIFYAIFGVYPLFYSLILSFQDWKPQGARFIGLDNYVRLFSDSVFWTALWNTMYILIINVPIMTLLALIMAFVLNSPHVRFRKGFQLIYLLPYVTSAVAIGLVFYILLDDTSGWVNLLLGAFGIPPVGWLRTQEWSKISIVLVVTWKWVGYNMLIMLGGLQSISPELYEAARLDGATEFKVFTKITMPLMKPVVLFCTIMSTIGTFNMFVEPYILTNGGPGYSSTTLTLFLYRTTFNYFQLGYGASISFVIFVLTIIFSLIQVKQALESNI